MKIFSVISNINLIVSFYICELTYHSTAIPFRSFYDVFDDIFESDYFQNILSKELTETFSKSRLLNQSTDLG